MAGLILIVSSYGSPGDCEQLKVNSPTNLTAWGEAAAKALEKTGGFILCTDEAGKELMANVDQIEWVYPK